MEAKPREIQYYTTSTGKQPVRQWLENIKDPMSMAILYKRLRQAGLGNLGNTRSLGSGVNEFKIDFGPGYRIYFGIHNDKIIVLLVGGTKRTQSDDIQIAKQYWSHWKKENNK